MSKFNLKDISFDMSDKVVLITGAAMGIGFEIARLFAKSGARLILTDLNPEIINIAKSLGKSSAGLEHLGFIANAADEQATIDLVKKAIKITQRVDILVNNAGIGILAKAEEMSSDIWDKTMNINARAPFIYAREVGRVMITQKYGRIINMASQAGVIALDQHLAYSTSKAALLGMTRALALEWGRHGITCNAISPTVVETELGRTAWAGEVGDRFKAQIPSGRFAQPQEIAQAVLYLASDGAGMINGANLLIDGGYSIT